MNDRLVTEVLGSYANGNKIWLVVRNPDVTKQFDKFVEPQENPNLLKGLKPGDWVLLKGKEVKGRSFLAISCEKIYKEKVIDVFGE
jgi:hypothetical protein